MNFIAEWWNAMNMLQQSFAVVAIPATVMLFLQTIMLLFGIGGSHDSDANTDVAESGDFSDDFDIAVEEGANLVRVGTALFGRRIYNTNNL